MKNVNQSESKNEYETISCKCVTRDKKSEIVDTVLIKEHMFTIHTTGFSLTLSCLCSHLLEFVYGRLFTMGVIEAVNDVENVRFDESKENAYVALKKEMFPSARQIVPFVEPIDFKPEWIFSITDFFNDNTPIHSVTHAAHSCILAKEGNVLFSCEDTGRHHALDKAIGYALLNGINLKECMLYGSGRVPTDMVVKVIGAGIPILISKALPTDKAVKLAKEKGLTLICQARKDSFKVFYKNSATTN